MITRWFVFGLICGAMIVWLQIPQRLHNVANGYGWCYRIDGSPMKAPVWDEQEQRAE